MPDQELVVHVFAPLDGPCAAEAYERVRALWRGLRPSRGETVPVSLSVMLDEKRTVHTIAAFDDPSTHTRAIVRREHGVLILSGAFSGRGWAELDRRWDELTGGVLDPFLGVARLYLTTTPADLDAIRPLLPFETGDRWRRDHLPEHGLTLWELGPSEDTRIERRIVVSAADRAWIWSRRDEPMPLFARYLFDTAMIRYHLRVYDDGGRIGEISRNTDEVGLLDVIEQLKLMGREIEGAVENIVLVAGRDHPDRSLFGDDLALAAWFGRQLDDDVTHLEAARRGEQRAERRERSPASAIGSVEDGARRVFVVHGRDEAVRRGMFDFLRALDLRPMEWESVVAASGCTSPFLCDAVRHGLSQAQAVVVLLTPDDVVRLHPDLHGVDELPEETEATCQPRPNVLIELGMALITHPERTIIVKLGAVRTIADLAGLNFIHFDGSVTSIKKLAARLAQAGCAVRDADDDWLEAHRFEGLRAYGRRPPSGP